jgi:hypothetical protein
MLPVLKGMFIMNIYNLAIIFPWILHLKTGVCIIQVNMVTFCIHVYDRHSQ